MGPGAGPAPVPPSPTGAGPFPLPSLGPPTEMCDHRQSPSGLAPASYEMSRARGRRLAATASAPQEEARSLPGSPQLSATPGAPWRQGRSPRGQDLLRCHWAQLSRGQIKQPPRSPSPGTRPPSSREEEALPPVSFHPTAGVGGPQHKSPETNLKHRTGSLLLQKLYKPSKSAFMYI